MIQISKSNFPNRLAFVVVLVAAIAGSGVGASGAALVNAIPTAESPSLRLGGNWYPFERYQGMSFRWVDDNAEFIVLKQPTSRARLVLTVEAGPSLGRTAFPLYVLNAKHEVVQTIQVSRRSTVELSLPVAKADAKHPFAETVFYLHADSSNHPVPHDPRRLNFRVFSIEDLRPIVASEGPDVYDPHNFVRIGDGWYPVEHANNQTFRWVNNDAKIYVQSDKNQQAPLRILMAAGPSASNHYTLKLLNEAGKTVGQISGSGFAQKRFEQIVSLSTGENEFSLHMDGGGKALARDPHRILNFRVFSVAAVR